MRWSWCNGLNYIYFHHRVAQRFTEVFTEENIAASPHLIFFIFFLCENLCETLRNSVVIFFIRTMSEY